MVLLPISRAAIARAVQEAHRRKSGPTFAGVSLICSRALRAQPRGSARHARCPGKSDGTGIRLDAGRRYELRKAAVAMEAQDAHVLTEVFHPGRTVVALSASPSGPDYEPVAARFSRKRKFRARGFSAGPGRAGPDATFWHRFGRRHNGTPGEELHPARDLAEAEYPSTSNDRLLPSSSDFMQNQSLFRRSR